VITHARVGSTGAVAGRAGSIEAVRSTVAYVASLSHSTYLLYGLETSHCIRVTSVHPPDVAAARGRPVGASRALIIGSRSPQSSRAAKSRAVHQQQCAYRHHIVPYKWSSTPYSMERACLMESNSRLPRDQIRGETRFCQ